jgi:hypothetical protein
LRHCVHFILRKEGETQSRQGAKGRGRTAFHLSVIASLRSIHPAEGKGKRKAAKAPRGIAGLHFILASSRHCVQFIVREERKTQSRQGAKGRGRTAFHLSVIASLRSIHPAEGKGKRKAAKAPRGIAGLHFILASSRHCVQFIVREERKTQSGIAGLHFILASLRHCVQFILRKEEKTQSRQGAKRHRRAAFHLSVIASLRSIHCAGGKENAKPPRRKAASQGCISSSRHRVIAFNSSCGRKGKRKAAKVQSGVAGLLFT